MPAFDSPVRDVHALHLAGTLGAYERDVEALLEGFDPQRYASVCRHMEQLRRCAAFLPALSGQWVEVLIRHAELTQALWSGRPSAAGPDLALLQDGLRDAVRRLSHRCLELLPAAGSDPA